MRANFQKNYLMRYLVLTVVCFFLALWFGYDGLIGYPRQLEHARAYDALSDELDESERMNQWREIAAGNNWPGETPEKRAEEIESDIRVQYIFVVITLVAGVIALLYFLRSKDAWVESTETGLKTSWGQQLNFADVSQLNKRKWETKGVAKTKYTSGGQTHVFVFDDFKYEREPLGQILRDLEAVLKPEQIVGGPPESDKPQHEEVESQS